MIKIAQLFLTLTILVTLHELGHFFFARLFKTKVEKFYLFFDFLFPFAGVMNFSLFKKKIGDTEYGLGWLPFGGYVQIAGMIDEQMDKSILEKAPEPWEFRSKPKWQRLLIMFGGILVNLILGVFIFWMVFLAYGKETIPVSGLKDGIYCDSLAIEMGFKDGDKILSIDSIPVSNLRRVTVDIVMNRAKSVLVERDHRQVIIPIKEDDISRLLKHLKSGTFIEPRYRAKIDSLQPDSPGKKAGLQKGDVIIAINNKPLPFFHQYSAELQKNKNKTIDLTFIRGRDTLTKNIKLTAEAKIGFYPSNDYVHVEHYGLFSSLKQGVVDGYETLIMQAKQLAVIFTVKDAHTQVGGFYTMVKSQSPTWDWHSFWLRTALFSLVLAFMNFLPVPMLDGGYIFFLLIEMITRRNLPEKFIFYANYVGLALVLGLMLYANTDWLREMLNK